MDKRYCPHCGIGVLELNEKDYYGPLFQCKECEALFSKENLKKNKKEYRWKIILFQLLQKGRIL